MAGTFYHARHTQNFSYLVSFQTMRDLSLEAERIISGNLGLVAICADPGCYEIAASSQRDIL